MAFESSKTITRKEYALIKGWLLDCYPSLNEEGMTFWIKTEDGTNIALKDSIWHARIYAAGFACDSSEFLFSKLKDSGLVSNVSVVKKRTSIFDWKKSNALEIELRRADNGKKVADLLESIFNNPSTFKLYNVDVVAEQQYFLEKNLFPLAHVGIYTRGNEIIKWRVMDSVEAIDYKIPRLKVMGVSVNIATKVPTLGSRLESVILTPSIYDAKTQDMDHVEVKRNDEESTLVETQNLIRQFDPDFIVTENGDAFVIPYLYSKAQRLGISFNLDRDESAQKIVHNVRTGGKTYFSYGRIMYRPTTQRFYGRIHVDEENTFVYDQCRFEGLFEIARISRMPFHTSSRASIGKSLSGLQFYRAHLRDILIPYKPVVSEDIKSMENLLVADRGGLVFVPLPGIHERVCELDFASLYPSIIRQRNISAETVNCPCCPDSDNFIEELEMHICKKKLGIVPESLELPLSKRFEYKKLREKTDDLRLKQVYSERAGALKWVLVTCLARESLVLIKQNGLVQYAQIGDFIDHVLGDKIGIVDCQAGISVAGVDRTMKSKFCDIEKLLKIPNNQKLLKIIMDDGRKIVATPDHNFYLLKNERLEVKQASELEIGDFIPTAKKLPSSDLGERFIDVITQFSKRLDYDELIRCRVSGQVLPKLILDNKQAVFVAATGEGYSDKVAQTIERILGSQKLYGKESIVSFENVKRVFQSDLTFVRVRKIVKLNRADEYVYCFKLADHEFPGFFAGDGAVFTHNCFGYLSYRHAKFMKIDAHIAVCSIARQTLLDAMHIAELRGYQVIHGIIDSLWVFRERAELGHYQSLRDEIEDFTKFKLGIEGIYKWIVFLPSKIDPQNQVSTQYFGCFEKNNEIKVRGIELRRHDTPIYFKKCQAEILSLLAKCNDMDELKKSVKMNGLQIFEEYAARLEKYDVPPAELLINRRLSKNLDEYSTKKLLSVDASMQLSQAGLKLQAGQSVSYIITRYENLRHRTIPEEFVENFSEYDSKRYVRLLASCCSTLLSPFGITEEMLLTRSRPLFV